MSLGKVLYGLLFAIALPIALVLWAGATSGTIHLATPRWPLIGWTVTGLGIALMLEAMRELWSRGGGLPMNAYPPPRLVSSGMYALLPHPIYFSFCTACLGVSVATGSAGGLWLVTPMVTISCIALVIGYEGPELSRRFAGAGPLPLLRAPDTGDARPTMRDRLVIDPLLFLPWLILYEGWGHAQPAGLAAFVFAGETNWPVVEWTTYIYSLAYPFTLCVPLLLRRRTDLRDFVEAGFFAVALAMLVYIVFPVKFPPREMDPSAFGAWLLALERSDNLKGAVAFPSFHVVWAILAASAYSRMGRAWSAIAWSLSLAIIASCITTGMHSVADIALAFGISAVVIQRRSIWRLLLRVSTRIANSFASVRLGSLRIINPAAYAGLAAATGIFLSATLAGPESAKHLGTIALCSLVGAALWGQLLVGSRTLLRPFGYFGALLGALFGLAWLLLFENSTAFWTLAGALATAAPWIVAIGRLRCLVQGCCHGRPVDAHRGIIYHHPLSRVCSIAHLQGIPLHPTPLYSMLSSIVIGLLLARLWSLQAPHAIIAGVYLALAGFARFVEESRRGEPQTQIIAGLRIYQWLAILSVIAGAGVTSLKSPTAAGGVSPSITAAWWALLIGVVFAVAMGVDFPSSNRRFSRLV